MAKFSNKVKEVTTYEGAPAVEKAVEEEWVNALFSSFLAEGFYETAAMRESRFVRLTREMVDKRGINFVSNAAHFSRNILGMRSVSALTAAILNEYSFKNKRGFYRDYFHRPDDVAEVFSAVDMLGGKRSHALVKGAGDYLSGLSDYSIGKYKLKGREYNMYDLINLTHAHSDAIEKYKTDTLPTPETWETAISAADASEKGEVWAKLIEDKKLGYMALLRNLRNLVTYVEKPVSWWWDNVYLQLANKEAIKKSLVFPYRIYVAHKELQRARKELQCANSMTASNVVVLNLLRSWLAEAFVASMDNAPKMPGRNLVVVDVSGSMSQSMSPKSSITLAEVGACYAAIIALNSDEWDFVKFGSKAKKYKAADLKGDIFDEIDDMATNENLGYGTLLSEVWREVSHQRYDRVFIISDMQVMDAKGKNNTGWMDTKGQIDLEDYCRMTESSPLVYTFDLGNYHESPADFNGRVKYFTSLSAEVLKFISLLENDMSICDYIDSLYWAD